MFDHLVDQSYDVVFDMGLYPICAGMCHALGIPHIIDREVGPLDPRCKLSIGQIVLAFIINILHGRTPLYHMADAFSKVDCGVLFGEGVTHEDFTEDRLYLMPFGQFLYTTAGIRRGVYRSATGWTPYVAVAVSF